MLILVVLVLLKLNEESSILTVFIITLFFNYMNGLSLASIPGKCNPFHNKAIDKNNFLYSSIMHIVINTALATLAITYKSLSKKSSRNMQTLALIKSNPQTKEDDGVSKTESTENIIIKEIQNENFNDEEMKSNLKQFIYFHLSMILLSFYIVMIFFDWKDLSGSLESWSELSSENQTGFIIKTIAAVVFVLMYLWTLIAPAILRNRQFGRL